MTPAPTPGRLYLVPTPLDFGCDDVAPLTDVLPDLTLRTAARLTHWVSENAKTTRAFLKRVGECHPLSAPMLEMQILELPRHVHKSGDHDGSFEARPLLAAALLGHDVGLVSEAGMPTVADPGSSVVRAAHMLGVQVLPLVGPVSLLLALSASGLNGQNFAFVGYVPQDKAQRAQRLKGLEGLAQGQGQTQILIETPYRNAALWEALLGTLQGRTRVAVASGLSLPQCRCQCLTVDNWRQRPLPVDKDTPAVFLIGR